MSILYGNEADALERSRPSFEEQDDDACGRCGATTKSECECPRLGDDE